MQQLSQATNAGIVPPTQPIPVPVSLVPSSAPANAVPPVTAPVGGPTQPLPYYRDDRNGFARKEPQYERYGGPDRPKEFHDDRRDPRGAHRGGFRNDFRGDHRGDHRGNHRGAFRGRGRGRWDDHDRRTHSRDPDWGQPSPRFRTSRSRSPSHARFGRDNSPRPDNIPQGTPVFRMPDMAETTEGAPEVGKDEFGRDLRPPSPLENASASTTDTPGQSSLLQDAVASVSTVDASPFSIPINQTAIATQSAPVTSIVHSPTASTSSAREQNGLDVLDLSVFDPTSPSSWEALAHAWQVTHGYMPQQDQLMQYIMSANTSMAVNPYPVNQYSEQQTETWPGQDGWGNRGSWRGRGRGRGRARSGFGFGNGRDRHADQGTDALTLTGGEDEPGFVPGWQNPAIMEIGPDHGNHTGTTPISPAAGGTRAGRMQRIGDKWVFVKGDTIASEGA